MRVIIRTVFLLLVVVFVSAACIVPFGPSLVRGSGDIIVEDRDVSDFDEILVSGTGTVIVSQGKTESLTIETDDNLTRYINSEVKGNTLEIGFVDGIVFSRGGGRKALEPSEGFIFRITVKDLQAITLSGAARFEIEKLKTESLDITLSGAGDITIEDLNADRLDVTVSGAGDVHAAGVVKDQNVKLNGLGRYQAFDLESQRANVMISGAGGAEIWVKEALDVVISGAGDVKYFGSPSISPEISGLGRIQDQGEK